jgi:L-rhamnose mutarotase
MQRFGTVTRLRPELRTRYLELHRQVPAAVEAALSRAHIRNYTIFVHGDLLFGYYEYAGVSHAEDVAQIAADEATQVWWTSTDPCQEQLPGATADSMWSPMTEAWHLD